MEKDFENIKVYINKEGSIQVSKAKHPQLSD